MSTFALVVYVTLYCCLGVAIERFRIKVPGSMMLALLTSAVAYALVHVTDVVLRMQQDAQIVVFESVFAFWIGGVTLLLMRSNTRRRS